MKITVLTLFPEMFAPLKESILGRAQKSGKIELSIVDIRDFSEDRHKKCDDYPFGGGAGMVMTPQPISSAIMACDPHHRAHRIYLSPKGKLFCQSMVGELLPYGELLLLCGHYEGVDQRVIDLYIDEEISIGDYVLTGGELPAMVICDCVARYVDGVISEDSLKDESISSGGLEYPQYTRPATFSGVDVPQILLSGDHEKIAKWRREESLKLTKSRRPDLLAPDLIDNAPATPDSPPDDFKKGDKR